MLELKFECLLIDEYAMISKCGFLDFVGNLMEDKNLVFLKIGMDRLAMTCLECYV